ncbi:MAG: hypothetical protein N3E36_00680 [Sulfolobales archaeon]|nr:hypothetical protein [Sulfolobales archaeon]
MNSLVEELLKCFSEKVIPKLKAISDETKRFLYFIAWLNNFLKSKSLGRIVITGGFAVELYTGRVYRTMDVDIIIEGSEAVDIVKKFLESFSDSIGRGFLPSYDILQLKSIDIVSSVYTKQVEPVEVCIEGLCAYVEPVEELIITYLSGWKYWGSTEDRDKALWLLASWFNKVDWAFLENRALNNNVYDRLLELRRLLESSIST